MVNPGYTISSLKRSRKALPGRWPHRRRGKTWGNRHLQGNACSWPSLTGRASYTNTSSPGMFGLTGDITSKCCKKCASTLQKSALTSKSSECRTTITYDLMSWNRSRHSYKSTTLKWWCTFHTVRISRPVIFGCFPTWRQHYTDAGLRRIRSCWMLFRHSSMPFQKPISRKPSSSTGNNGYVIALQAMAIFWKRNSCNL